MQDVELNLRQCKTCLQDKPLDDFYKSNGSWGQSRQCKVCTCERTRRYAAARKEQYAQYGRNYRKENPEAASLAQKKWRKNNRESFNSMHRRIRRDNPNARVADRFRGRLRELVRSKHKKSLDILGCTPDQLRAHLESLWLPGMSWDNYGLHGWHIDHKKPCSGFDLTQPSQVEQCFHYSNLQPMWAFDNLSKGGINRQQ